MDTLAADLRFAARLLRRSPVFAAVAILTLALGIGANTAIFSVVDSVLLRPLPYRPGGEVVVLGEKMTCCDFAPMSPANLLDFQRYLRGFEQLAGTNGTDCALTRRGGEPFWLQGLQVTPNYFAVFGIPAQLGRTLSPAIDRPGAPGALVLANATWRRHFGGDPAAVGTVVQVNGRPHTIVGVMPQDFSLLSRAELWVAAPFAAPTPDSDPTGQMVSHRDDNYIRPLGRLRPGVSLEQARAELITISHRLERAFPDENASKVAQLRPLRDWVVGRAGPDLWLLLGAVGLILLIACANLANLLLARGTVRAREMALRASLGAGRPRLVRQQLTETLLMGLLGGGLGLALAALGVYLLGVLRPGNLPRVGEVRIHPEALLFTLAAALLSALLAGLAPALRALRFDLRSALAEGGRGTAGAGGAAGGLRRGLVVAEIAMSLALLIGAGLLIRSFAKLLEVSPGFDPEGVVAADLPLSQARYPAEPQVVDWTDRLLRRVAALPGVTAAGTVDAVPFGNTSTDGDILIEGRPKPRAGMGTDAQKRIAGGDYFRAMGIPLLRGRVFDGRDNAAGLPVVIVNEHLARYAWPGQDPLGKRLRWDDGTGGSWLTVVGVVGNLHMFSLDEKPTLDTYRPQAQRPIHTFTLVVRRAAEPLALAAQLRQEVLALDRQQPIARIELVSRRLDGSLELRRFQMLLLGSLALLALLLASIGIYGVMSYAVVQRTREIGVRLALGAPRRQVLALVLRGALAMTGMGIGTGVAGSLVLGRWMGALLYGVSGFDPAAYALGCTVLSGVALLAAFLPARRASAIDPLVSLRAE